MMTGKTARRCFICGDFKFPHGDAVANRMQYIARMVEDMGMEAYVVGVGENNPGEWNEEIKAYIHEGIRYQNVRRRAGNAADFLKRGLRAGRILAEKGIAAEDIVLVSSIWPHYTSLIRSRINSGATFVFDVMEWFQPFQFRGGRLNPWYQAYNYYFTHTARSGKRIIVISRELEKYYTQRGYEAFCLPLVLDPYDYPCREREDCEKIRFIYPGNPGKKDAMNVMLKGLSLLDADERRTVEFHIAGVKKETLEQVLAKERNLLDKVSDIVRFHDWLSYSELYDLYNQMDFFLLAKEDNLVSRSNFPSKVPELTSCGVVPVMNRVGDAAGYLQDGVNCIFFEACSAEACAAGIRRALRMSRGEIRRLSRAARENAEAVFDYRKWSRKLVEYLCGE